MSLFGRKHLIQCSTTNQDTTSLEAVDARFKLRGGHNTSHSTPEFYRSSMETGNESHLEQGAPTPVAVSYTKAAEFAGDTEASSFFLYWATHGGAAATSTAVTSSSPAVNEQVWEGPTTAYVNRAFSMEDIGDNAGSDADFNRDVHNVTVERCVISGRRSNTVDAVIGVAADLRGGGATAASGSATSVTFKRTALLNFGMTHVLTTTNTSFDTTPASTFFNGTTAPNTDAGCEANTMLTTGAIQYLTAAIQEFQIIATQSLDLARSMAPGNLDANAAAYVPDSADWIYSNDAQQLEFEMVFNQDDSTGVVEGLGLENAAGTRRSFEIWIVHPTPDTAPTNDLYYGIKVTCAGMSPISWREENDGMGERYVRVRYRANWDTVADNGWHIAATTQFAQYGA